jgi:predicted Zn-dependent peptidase
MQADGSPRFDMMFHTPGYPSDDLYSLDIVQGIFSGKSGRLYKRLVNDEGLCTDAGAENNFRLHDGYFHIWANLKNSTDPVKIETIIREEITRISTLPPSPREMMRITNDIRMSFVKGLESLERLSDQLAWFERLGSWKDLEAYPSKINTITADMIPSVAVKYLDPDKATIGLLLPEQKKNTSSGDNKNQSTGGSH